MICPTCGRYAPPDRETGYNGDDYCSPVCAKIAEQELAGRIWELEERFLNIRELINKDRLQRTLAAHIVFYYKNTLQTEEIHANGVTPQNEEGSDMCSICRRPVVDGKWHNHPCE